ncbi:MAG: HAD family hydrolase [Blastocatellia bacterium]
MANTIANGFKEDGRGVMIRAISFDFWNTLFTEPPGGFALYKQRRLRLLEAALRDCGEFSGARLEAACHVESRSHEQIWRGQYRTLTTAERLGRILAHLEACLPDEVMAETVRAVEEGILEHPPVLVEGARAAVERLAGRYRLGIISDVGFSPGRILKQVLADNHLLDAFDSLVFSDEAGRSKPHREVFEKTAARLGAAPTEMAHIGDLEFTDVVGAKQAGYTAIRFTGITPMQDGETTIADFVIDNYSELPRLVEEL